MDSQPIDQEDKADAISPTDFRSQPMRGDHSNIPDLPNLQEELPNEGARQKTYKREISILIFSICLLWSMWSGDSAFLEVTFVPTLFLLAAAMGLQEFSTNLSTRRSGFPPD